MQKKIKSRLMILPKEFSQENIPEYYKTVEKIALSIICNLKWIVWDMCIYIHNSLTHLDMAKCAVFA